MFALFTFTQVGAYAHGNEPTHHVPFFRPASDSRNYVEHILEKLYDDTAEGLPGNDDAGQMSAWYVLATLGIYPVDPTGVKYDAFAPHVAHAVVNEPGGRRHTLTVHHSRNDKLTDDAPAGMDMVTTLHPKHLTVHAKPKAHGSFNSKLKEDTDVDVPAHMRGYTTAHPLGGLFVKTGDIPEMWIRDSVAQIWPYRDSHQAFVQRVLFLQSKLILHDVY